MHGLVCADMQYLTDLLDKAGVSLKEGAAWWCASKTNIARNGAECFSSREDVQEGLHGQEGSYFRYIYEHLRVLMPNMPTVFPLPDGPRRATSWPPLKDPLAPFRR